MLWIPTKQVLITMILLISFAVGVPVVAQTTFGIIRGRVLDPTGAVVPNANVTVTNTATNIAKTAVTNDAGAYEVGYLQPGTYSVAVEAPGFKKFIAEGVVLTANAIVLVDANLQVGELSSSVTVQGGAPLIVTETATVTDVKTQEQYLKAPMNVFKSFRIQERWRLQAEATFTNVLNHPNYGLPNAVINSASAGVITQTRDQQTSAHEGSGPRTTRLGLRLDF